VNGYFIHLLDILAHETSVLWAPTHPTSLIFCSSSSKAESKAMQEIWDNTSVDPCSNLPNESMWPYIAVSTYLMELFMEKNLPCLGWSKGSSVPLLVSHFLKLIGVNMITIILWFLNIRHSATLFGMWFLTLAQQIFLLILPSKG
jgi:hypothetical protein